VSYAIAPTFEANKIGVRRAYTLGDFRGAPDALALQMIQDGYDISTITTLADNNVTDAQLQNLYDNYGAGTPEFAAAANALVVQLSRASGGAISPGTSPVLPLNPGASPSSQPPANASVPSGSIFTYTAQWSTSLLNVSSPSQILASVYNILQQHNINIINSSIPSTIVGQATGFTIVIQTTIGFAQLADIKSICDGAVYQAGRQVTSSVLTPGGSAMPGGLSNPAGAGGIPGSLTTWFTQNWGTVAAVLVGIAVLPALVKKL
jgi:hypothetical protein